MKNQNKNLLTFAVIICFIIAAIASSTDGDSSESSKFINGLAPVDVYLNMEKEGFKTDKQLGGEYGNSWTSTKSYAGIDYKVETFSSNTGNVENVRGTAIIDPSQKQVIATQQFFIFLSSLPYENSDPNKAGQWVIENFNNDKASIVIGDAKLTIYAPSVTTRMLTIEKSK